MEHFKIIYLTNGFVIWFLFLLFYIYDNGVVQTLEDIRSNPFRWALAFIASIFIWPGIFVMAVLKRFGII